MLPMVHLTLPVPFTSGVLPRLDGSRRRVPCHGGYLHLAENDISEIGTVAEHVFFSAHESRRGPSSPPAEAVGTAGAAAAAGMAYSVAATVVAAADSGSVAAAAVAADSGSAAAADLGLAAAAETAGGGDGRGGGASGGGGDGAGCGRVEALTRPSGGGGGGRVSGTEPLSTHQHALWRPSDSRRRVHPPPSRPCTGTSPRLW